jgi:hypothetical protein
MLLIRFNDAWSEMLWRQVAHIIIVSPRKDTIGAPQDVDEPSVGGPFSHVVLPPKNLRATAQTTADPPLGSPGSQHMPTGHHVSAAWISRIRSSRYVFSISAAWQ